MLRNDVIYGLHNTSGHDYGLRVVTIDPEERASAGLATHMLLNFPK